MLFVRERCERKKAKRNNNSGLLFFVVVVVFVNFRRYSNNPKYFGGIVSFNSTDMNAINGFPNTFWGWGGEDDEMQKRCEKMHLKWQYPNSGSITGDRFSNASEATRFRQATTRQQATTRLGR